MEPLDDDLQHLDRRRGAVTDAAGRFTLEPDAFPAPPFQGHLRLTAMNRNETDVPVEIRPDRAVVRRVESCPCVQGEGSAVPRH